MMMMLRSIFNKIKQHITSNDPIYSIRQSNFFLKEESRLNNDQNLEELYLIWLDSNMNKTNDCKEIESQLRSINSYLKTFDNIDDFLHYIQSIGPEEKIFFIVSGNLGESTVPQIYNLSNIQSIYVFCHNKTKHKIWANQFKPKMKGVFNKKDLLYSKLTCDIQSCTKNFLPMSILSPDAKQQSIRDL
ncbi:unnamed protein product, partial [Rotaria sp. Silwood2]